MKTTKLLLCLALGALVSTGAFAQNQNKKQERKGGGKNEGQRTEMMKQLSEDQKKQVKAIKDANKAELATLQSQMRDKQAALRKLETAEAPDMSAINSTIDEMGTIFTKTAKLRAEQRQKIRAVLTPEQRAEYNTNMQRRQDKDRQQMGKGKKPIQTVDDLDDDAYYPNPDSED